MGTLKAWVRNIVLVILFANFIEMLLPNSKMRNYVRVVIGFFVILVILNPILNLVNYRFSNLSLGTIINDNKPSFQKIVSKGEELQYDGSKEVREDYQKKLVNQIEAITNISSGINNLEIDIKLNKDNRIEKIIIQGEDNRVKPVNVDLSDQPKQKDNLKSNLKELIASFYGLDSDQILIYLE